MKRGQKGGQRRLETKAKRGLQTEERGLQKLMKKAENKAQKVAAKENQKRAAKGEERGLKRAVQKVKKRAKVDSEGWEEVAAIKRQIRLQISNRTANRGIRLGE